MSGTGEKELSYETMKNIRWMKNKSERDQEIQKAKNRAVNNCTPAVNRLKAGKKWPSMSETEQAEAEKAIRDKYAAKLAKDIEDINKKFVVASETETLRPGMSRRGHTPITSKTIAEAGPSKAPAMSSQDLGTVGEDINLFDFPNCRPFIFPGMTDRQIRKANRAAQSSRKLMARLIWNGMRKERKMPPDSIKNALTEKDIEISESEEEDEMDIDEEEGELIDDEEEEEEEDDDEEDESMSEASEEAVEEE